MSGNSYTPVTYYTGCQDGNVSPIHSQTGEPKSVQVLDISQPISYESFTSDPRHLYMRHLDPVYSTIMRKDDRMERKTWDFEPSPLDREIKPMLSSSHNPIKLEPDRYDRHDLESSWLEKLPYDPSMASRNDTKLSLNTIPISPYLQVAERFVNELSDPKDSYVDSPVDTGSHSQVEMSSLLPVVSEQVGLAEDISVSPRGDHEHRPGLEEDGSNLTSNSYPISLYAGVSTGTPSVNSEASVIVSTSIHINSYGQDLGQDASQELSPNSSSNTSLQEPPLDRFACNSCDKVFVNRNKLSMHKRAHRKKHKVQQKAVTDASNSGELMGEISTSSQDQKLSTDNDGSSFICSTCGRGFRLKMALACHMRYHAEERTYTCNDCNLTFSSRWVRSPQLCDKCRHGPGAKPVPKPCRCERCGKCFKDARLLRDHTRSHTGERPFACQVCGKTFAQSGTLYRHKQVHSDSRPYRCTQCNKSYKLKGHLTVHVKSHTI
ncbi:hypothetical protein FOCC_FOCC005317 [Frankliniella occidentalis]|uniref:Zinc finger protein 37 n=1 Tax=Frankliniella occidentalis TaxID=133901 RepID=A0A6J1T716_FRAOC|nr:zinc finger protein 37 [Frankliniella occidentalis]KAE8747928.1 hypothetical protein FOCC_FOCC005317 [Frankliniella occidentalis]